MATKRETPQPERAAATWEPVDSLHPWAKNPRKNDESVPRVAKSIARFGFGAPIVARTADRRIIAGHTRWKAAQSIGMTEVPVRFLDVDEDEAAALALADNRLTEVTPWDDEALAEVMRDLDANGVDLDGLGWTPEELSEMIDGLAAAETEPGEAPEVDEVGPVHSQLGEVYQLGPHRLWCGDAVDHWGEMARPDACVVFDPPWDAEIAHREIPPGAASLLVFGDGASIGGQIASRAAPPAWVFAWDCVSSWWTPGRPLRRMKLCAWYGDVAKFDQHGWHYKPDGFDPSEEREVTNTRGASDWKSDPRGRMLSDVYQRPITKLHADGEHAHSKPVDWMAMLIGDTSPAIIVVDLFAGSGTSMMAAQILGRTAHLVELSPRYCDVIRRRWTQWAREHGQDPGDGALEPV